MRYFRLLFYSLIEFLHIYLAWNLYRAFRSRRWGWCAALFALLPLVLLYARSSLRRYFDSYWVMQGFYYWIGLLLVVVVILLMRDALHLLLRLVDRLAGTSYRRPLAGQRSIRIALCLGVVGFCYSLHEAKAIRIRELTVKTAKLPAGVDQVRIAVLADLHLVRQTPDWEIERIVSLTNATQPDYIVLVGDYVDGRLKAGGREAKLLRGLTATRGKYAVHGNHELYRGLEQAEAFVISAGFTLLRGEAAILPDLAIVGVDDPQIPDRRGIADTLADLGDSDRFVLLLSHRPEAPAETLGRFDFQVAGHTHGGQVWPGRYILRYIHGFGQGLTVLDAPNGGRSLVYVSNGTRFWGPPVRFLTPPEITVVHLEREAGY